MAPASNIPEKGKETAPIAASNPEHRILIVINKIRQFLIDIDFHGSYGKNQLQTDLFVLI